MSEHQEQRAQEVGRVVRYPNVAVVRLEARRVWERRARKETSLQERIGESIPWWLIITAAMFFALSAPHTAEVFNRLTPGWGKAAPLAVEFGLLYASFYRKKVGHWRDVPLMLWALEALLFVTAVIVNGAGSFLAVLSKDTGLVGLSFEELAGQFRTLPAGSQVALVLVPIAALIIPIGTAVTGHGLATLFLEQQERGSLLKDRWRTEGPQVEYEALRDAALGAGVPPGRAVRWAAQIVSMPLPSDTVSEVSGADSGGQVADTKPPASPRDGQPDGHGTGQGYTKQMDARTVVLDYLREHPDARDLSVRRLAEASGVGKSTAADVLSDFRSNGHSKEYDQ